jgi:pimeloyl-ACP methyl ester carboxylesterase
MHVEPFVATLPDDAVADLRDRLARTRWPEAETTAGSWDQGAPLEYVRDLCRWWAEEYDFGFVDRLNTFEQLRTTLAGGGDEPLSIHAIHVRSPEPDAVPLLLTHGWPGSVLEFLDVIGPLADPRAHGGDPGDAFHVVCPALPGYGFSDKPTRPGWGVPRIAAAWHELMIGLGYDRYGAQGGDWGAAVTTSIARQFPDPLVGIHVNLASAGPDPATTDDLTPSEQAALADLAEHAKNGTGYSKQQSTRPQTLGYGLTDSPAGQAAWVAEKFWAWTDNDGHPEDALTRQQILDDISMYWFTASAASSARLYWESFGDRDQTPITVPSGVTIFPREIIRPSRRWTERVFTDLRWYEEMTRGGHFAALEEPDLFVDQVRSFFRLVR